MFLSLFYPNAYVESIYSIDYSKLYNLGFRGIIFDIDNTLVPHGKDSNKNVDQFFNMLHDIGFKTLLLSNNSISRIERFNANIGTQYIADANKPNRNGFIKAVEMLNLNNQNTIVIGDQIFTDIMGANKAGLQNILVKYIGYYNNEWKGFRRIAENLILQAYKLFYKNSLKLDISTKD